MYVTPHKTTPSHNFIKTLVWDCLINMAVQLMAKCSPPIMLPLQVFQMLLWPWCDSFECSEEEDRNMRNSMFAFVIGGFASNKGDTQSCAGFLTRGWCIVLHGAIFMRHDIKAGSFVSIM